MGWASQTATARASGGGNYLRDGKYKLAVEKAFVKNDDKGGWTFIAELRVLEAGPAGYEALDDKGKPIVPNKVGSTASFVQQSKFDSAPGNVKAFALGCLQNLGYTEESLTEAKLDSLVEQPKNSMFGLVVEMETFRKPKKSKPTEILTLPKWKPTAQTKETIKAMREYLTGKPAVVDANAGQTAAGTPVEQPKAEPKAPAPKTISEIDELLGEEI